MWPLKSNYYHMNKLLILLTIPVFVLFIIATGMAQQKTVILLIGKDIFVPLSAPGKDKNNTEKVSKDALIKAEKLTCMNTQYEIISFAVSVKIGDEIVSKQSKGKNLTPEIKSFMMKAHKGDKIWIEAIKARSADEKIVQLSGISFVLE